MAIIDSVLVEVITLPVINGSLQAYINRDKVLYYRQYIDEKGKVSENLTSVFLTANQGLSRVDAPLIVKMSLADFNVLMTT